MVWSALTMLGIYDHIRCRMDIWVVDEKDIDI